MTAIRFGNEAIEDLLALEEHLFAQSEKLADRVLRPILDRCNQLVDNPELGPRRPDIASDARSMLADRWVILYYLLPSGDVQIARIVDGARDLQALEWPEGGGS